MPQPLLNLVVIRSSDLERAQQFYEGFGLKFIRHQHGKGPEHLAYETDGFVFEIYPRQTEDDSTHPVRLGLIVDEIDYLLRRISEMDVVVLSQAKDSPWGRRAVIQDPDGHKVELVQR